MNENELIVAIDRILNENIIEEPPAITLEDEIEKVNAVLVAELEEVMSTTSKPVTSVIPPTSVVPPSSVISNNLPS